MKTVTILLINVLSINSYGQFYDSQGKKIGDDNMTIAQAIKATDPLGRIHVEHFFSESDEDYTIVGFKLFTKTPVWYATKRKVKLQDAIDEYHLSDYFKSDYFKSDMEKFIKAGSLTELFILGSLGKPDRKVQSYNSGIGIEIWTYEFRNLDLTFSKGKVISYIYSQD